MSWLLASHLVSVFSGGGLLKLFLGNLVSDFKAVVAFLKAHSVWLTVSIVLASGWGIDHVITHRALHKTELQLSKEVEARKKLVEQSKAQQKEVTRTIEHYVKVEVPVVKREVERIESAPLPGGCRTPDAVRNADV